MRTRSVNKNHVLIGEDGNNMENVKVLQQERQQLFDDIVDGKIPKRVPIMCNIQIDAAFAYAGYNVREGQWDDDILYDTIDKVASEFLTDTPICGPNMRNPLHYQILGSKSFVMGTSGTMQHPEVHSLEPEEYDTFCEDPYKFMCDKLLPRLYTALDTETTKAGMILAKAFKANADQKAKGTAVTAKIREKYGYATSGGAGQSEAPFDFLADLLRSFSGISKDIRRCPDKVEKACWAVLPMMEKLLIPQKPLKYRHSNIPLHMGPYLGKKHFEKLWWPSFEKLIEKATKAGQSVSLFVEHDWMRHIDYLASLPGRIQMRFEYGDPVIIKKKLGGKHVITGLYPSGMLLTNTKQECIDKAKELLDILAPGGGYIFNMDKTVYSINGNVAENFKAVLEYVYENGKY